MGIDASLSSTGVCIAKSNNETIEIIETSVIQTKKDDFKNEDLRIFYICKELAKKMIDNKVNRVVIEEQFMARNSKTVLSLRKMLGAIMYLVYEMGLELNYLYPTTVRKLLLNNGKAKKEEVAKYIRGNVIDIGEYSDRAGKKKTSDIYDATAIVVAYDKKIKNEGE